jgi:steroid 5-alpha reductase family enzyme
MRVTFAGPGAVLPIAAACVAGLMVAVWLVSLRIRDVSIVDPIWGPAFVLVAAAGLPAGSGAAARRWLLLAMVAGWGVRLGVHLLRRKLQEPGEDKRYAAMRRRRGSEAFALYSLVGIFGLQGVLVLVVSLPLQVGAERPAGLSAWIIPGLALYLLGLAFEAIGDEQLRRFKADPANQGKVMDRGLWRYTRHPNYFGDACVWWGLWLVVLPAGGTWWTFVGPVVMTVLLVRVSGAALLERDMAKRRPQYADYIRRTSGFIPLPPRSGARGGSG